MGAPTKRSKPPPNPPQNQLPAPTSGEAPVDFKDAKRQKKAELAVPTIDLPPHSVEAEQGVLGCIMLSPKECIGECIDKLKQGAEMFYDLRHQVIYSELLAMYDKNEPIDLITLQQKLKDKQQLEGVGGLIYLASLPDVVPSAANLDYYVAIVREKYVMRRMIGTATDAVIKSRSHFGEVDSLLDEVVNDMQQVAELSVVKASIYAVKQLIPETLSHIEKLLSGGPVLMSTGFEDLDEITWGLHPGEMFVLAARPSVGKTALAMNIAEHLSLNGYPVGVFSLEMNKESLMQRLICARARVNHHNIRKGILTGEEQSRILTAASTLAKAKLHIDDTPGLSLLQLRARARRMHQMHGIKAIVIDYLQLMHAKVRNSDNRQVEVSLISNGVKAIAKELSVPVIVLSQLSRKVEDRGNNAEPKLSDLRESGSVEQDADTVVLLHRVKEKGAEDNANAPVVPVNVIVAKNRNGPTGTANLVFLRYCTRFENAAPITDDVVPEEQADLL